MSKTSELSHPFRLLKAPAAARAVPTLAKRAREEEWSHERFLEAVLSSEVASRESHGGESRIKAARFPPERRSREFDSTFQRSVRKTVIEHLGQLDFLHGRENVVMLGPPGTGTPHLAIALGIRACLAGQRVAFATATEWVAKLGEAKRQGHLESELTRLGRVPLLIVDEVGHIPFDPAAANLMFSGLGPLRARQPDRHLEQGLLGLGEIFGDEVTAAAMIDRLGPPRRDPRPQGRLLEASRQDLGSPPPHDWSPARSSSPYGLNSAGALPHLGGPLSTGTGRSTFRPALTLGPHVSLSSCVRPLCGMPRREYCVALRSGPHSWRRRTQPRRGRRFFLLRGCGRRRDSLGDCAGGTSAGASSRAPRRRRTYCNPNTPPTALSLSTA